MTSLHIQNINVDLSRPLLHIKSIANEKVNERVT